MSDEVMQRGGGTSLDEYVLKRVPEAPVLLSAGYSPYELAAFSIFEQEAKCIRKHEKNESYSRYTEEALSFSSEGLSRIGKLVHGLYAKGAGDGFQDPEKLLGSSALKDLAGEIKRRYERGGFEEMDNFVSRALLVPAAESVARQTMPEVAQDDAFERMLAADPYKILILGCKRPELCTHLHSAEEIDQVYRAQTDYEENGLPMETMLSRLELKAGADSLKVEFEQAGNRQGGFVWAIKYINHNLGFQKFAGGPKDRKEMEHALADYAVDMGAFYFNRAIKESGGVDFAKKNPETVIALAHLYGKSADSLSLETARDMARYAENPEVKAMKEKISACYKGAPGTGEQRINALKDFLAQDRLARQTVHQSLKERCR